MDHQVSGWYPDLTEAERRLVQVVSSGEQLDLAGRKYRAGDLIPAEVMRGWGRRHTVRARVIRDILRGRLVGRPDPRGVRLRGARISGRLDLDYLIATIPLSLTDCVLPDGIAASGATLPALLLRGSLLTHRDLPPLGAARLTTTLLDLRLATVTARCDPAAVDLAGADLGLLDARGATLVNARGPAIDASESHIRRHARLSGFGEGYPTRKFEAAGHGERGTVRLCAAAVDGSLSMSHAEVSNHTGPSLTADGLDVRQDVLLDGGFTATGAGNLGVVRLAGGRIGGQLICSDATVTSADGSALTTDGLVVGQDLSLARLTACGGGGAAVLDLPNTSVGRVFHYQPATVTNIASAGSEVNVDGLTYRALPAGLTPTEWLQVIRQHTPAYAAQPYRHLAAALSAAGHDREARDVLIAQRQDQLERKALTGASQRGWARLTGVVLGYGYRSSRALLFLLGVLAVSVILATVLGAHGALAPPRLAGSASPVAPCTAVQRIAVGLDLGEPLAGPAAQCGTTLSATGSALTVLRWLLEAAAWAFVALFIAGFTSVVRRT
ncbi:MAG TPA: hypothetical protein VK836_13500 [Streptosporangiaceae bacterium]|nr:hypothetical protein [Streptosporangiaceae bacterium]